VVVINIINFIDLFAGIGGFRLGIERAASKLNIPVKCVFSSEIEKNARFIYERNFGEVPSGDIKTIYESGIPQHDILCGGFPCQAFSIAGQRKGFEDARGTLFFEIARIAAVRKPKLLFLENVKGLLNHKGGKTFGFILDTLDGLGYDAEWQVFNSKDYGVPQNRERVFIIGHLRGGRTRQIFPISGETTKTTRENSSTALVSSYFKGIDNHGERTHIMCIQKSHIQHYCGPHQQDRVIDSQGICSCLPTGTGGDLMPKILVYNTYATGINMPSRGPEPRNDGLSSCLKSGESGTKNLIFVGGIETDSRW
jgi:DNA (cytosine-5)-methyltransferase 1